jgi:RNA polymerase sigma factor (sigma-70 family)
MPPKGSPDRLPWLQAALHRHEGALLRYAARLTGNVERAREVVQDTFLKLWEADPADVDDHLAPWLFTVCRNRALDLRKKERRMTNFTQGADAVAGEDAGASKKFEEAETQSELLKVIGTLPDNQREVVRLKFQNDLSYKEIAEVTGLSVTNVGFLLHTAVQEMRRRMTGAPKKVKSGGAR